MFQVTVKQFNEMRTMRDSGNLCSKALVLRKGLAAMMRPNQSEVFNFSFFTFNKEL
jgi:hypothetical protein